MRVFDQNAFVRVCVSAFEISNFMNRWPCSELRARPIAFTFDKRDGCLVDIESRDRHNSNVSNDALLALSRDAWKQAHSQLRLKISTIHKGAPKLND